MLLVSIKYNTTFLHMKLKLIYFLVLFLSANYIVLAQSKNQLSIGNLVIYEIILSDTTSIKTTEKFRFLNDTEISNFCNQITSTYNDEQSIIINAGNRILKNKNEFESCFIHFDTALVENPKTKEIKQIVTKTSYLEKGAIVKLKFFEKWFLDTATNKMEKSVLAYSVIICKLLNGDEWKDQLLFTAVKDKSALEFLNDNQLFR